MSRDDEYAAIADLYDHVVAYRERTDVGFFVEEALRAGSPVLELGCGTGRVLLPTARAGITIVGLDASAAMLTTCRRRLEAEPEAVRARVTLVEGDMRGFELSRRFRLVTMPFRPFQHLLTVEDQLACLASVFRHLEPGGELILDLFNPSIDALATRPLGEEMVEGPAFTLPDGRQGIRHHRITAHDRAAQLNQIEMIYIMTHPDGRVERLIHPFQMRYFFRFEAEHLLARAGFEIRALYGGYDRSPFGSTYPGELIFVAARPDDPAAESPAVR
jgi:SAM-dependent methyltransferase